MAFVDVIKYNAPNDTVFAWKFPSEELRVGSQLIVGEGQNAIFVKGGQVYDVFDPGTYTLTTGNIPLVNRVINLPFGGQSPFSAEVWYISRLAKRDLKWGTPTPIPIMDTNLGFPVNLRAFGKWGARVRDTKSFLSQLVGRQGELNDQTIRSYFIGEIIQSISRSLSSFIGVNNISVLQLMSFVDDVTESASKRARVELDRFGVELVNFNIESINIPDEELQQIQAVYAKSLEVRELSRHTAGGAFTAVKSFEVLNNAAQNTSDGTMSTFLGAGLGVGVGLPIGQQLGSQMNVAAPSVANESAQMSPASRLKALKELFDVGMITQDEYELKRSQILSEL